MIDMITIFRNEFHIVVRFGTLVGCIGISLYYGYGCTLKFLSNPVTMNDQRVPLTSLPPIKISPFVGGRSSSISRYVTVSHCQRFLGELFVIVIQ